MASIDDVLLALGGLQADMKQVQKGLDEVKADGRERSANLHRRLDEQNDDIAKVREDLIISGQVTGQVRDVVKSVSDKVDAQAPHIEDIKKLKMIGTGFAGLLTLAGISFGALIATMGEATINTIRAWLRIT